MTCMLITKTILEEQILNYNISISVNVIGLGALIHSPILWEFVFYFEQIYIFIHKKYLAIDIFRLIKKIKRTKISTIF